MRWTQWMGLVSVAALLWNAGKLGQLWGMRESRGDLLIVSGMTAIFAVLFGTGLYLVANP